MLTRLHKIIGERLYILMYRNLNAKAHVLYITHAHDAVTDQPGIVRDVQYTHVHRLRTVQSLPKSFAVTKMSWVVNFLIYTPSSIVAQVKIIRSSVNSHHSTRMRFVIGIKMFQLELNLTKTPL